MSRTKSGPDRVVARLTELLRDHTPAPTPIELERGLTQLRTRLATRGAGIRIRPWALRAAAAAIGVALAFLVFWRLQGQPRSLPPIAVSKVLGGQLLQGGYLSESSPEGVRLLFDEGSEVALTHGGRGRVRFEDGVRLMLERGSASLQITPTKEPRWAVESGPFLVTVKGTDFTVGWDPTSELFELTLRRGRVVVSGPLVGEGFVLSPGQKLTVSLPRGETVITDARSTKPVAPAPSTSAAPPVPLANGDQGQTEVAQAPSPRAAPSASATSPLPPRQWRRALASGEWDRIIFEAEQGGLEATLEAASSDDLFALADAARYRRRVDLAQSALLSHRRRFPASSRAAEAAFLLGRVAELRAGGRLEALKRYDEYLSRAPNGTYAAEALGRKMTLVNEAGGPARAIAAEYLQRFPTGSYAGAARTLLGAKE